jgi:hypothetical protein
MISLRCLLLSLHLASATIARAQTSDYGGVPSSSNSSSVPSSSNSSAVVEAPVYYGDDDNKSIRGDYICVFNWTTVDNVDDAINTITGGAFSGDIQAAGMYSNLKMIKLRVTAEGNSTDRDAQKEYYRQKLMKWLTSGLVSYMEEVSDLTPAVV